MASAPIDYAEPRPLRLWLLPAATVVAGSLLSLVPLIVETPWWPPCGLLMLLGWRLLRPELWAAWVALPLGLLDDLIGGAALGSAAALWTIAFLAIDIPDGRMVYRAFIDEWQIAAAAILFVVVGQWAIAWFTGGPSPLWTIAVQLAVSLLCFPMALRICSRLDGWRLSHGQASGATAAMP